MNQFFMPPVLNERSVRYKMRSLANFDLNKYLRYKCFDSFFYNFTTILNISKKCHHSSRDDEFTYVNGKLFGYAN